MAWDTYAAQKHNTASTSKHHGTWKVFNMRDRILSGGATVNAITLQASGLWLCVGF